MWQPLSQNLLHLYGKKNDKSQYFCLNLILKMWLGISASSHPARLHGRNRVLPHTKVGKASWSSGRKSTKSCSKTSQFERIFSFLVFSGIFYTNKPLLIGIFTVEVYFKYTDIPEIPAFPFNCTRNSLITWKL